MADEIFVCICVCVYVCGCVGVCVFVCVHGYERKRKGLELRGVDPHHLCACPPKYPWPSIPAVIIDRWPTVAVYC